jgi:hypothetical protein
MRYGFVNALLMISFSYCLPSISRRTVCNTPQQTAADIFRELYGFACGETGANRTCAASDGVETGQCQYGFKKRLYMLDVYNDLAGGDIIKFRTFSLFLPRALLLAQFHTGACPTAEAASCTDAFTDPIRKTIASDQVAAFNEVLANLNRTEECFIEEFRTNINEDLLKSIPNNEDCLGREGANEGEKNKCLADAAIIFLTPRFTNWDFLVVTYSYQDVGDKDKREIVDWGGNDTSSLYGFFHFSDIVGIGNRHYHIMYRAKEGTTPKKETWVDDSGINALEWVLDFDSRKPFACIILTSCGCATANKFWWETELNSEGNLGPTTCNGCSVGPGFRPIAAREHGFIVFQTNRGVPRDYASFNLGRFNVYWAPQLGVGGVDIVPSCDFQVEFIA